MTSGSTNPIQEINEAWASIYPLFHWILEHPLGSLLTGFIGLYLLWGLLRGLVQLTESLWVRLLRSPLWLIQQLWALTGKSRSTMPGLNPLQSATTERDRLQSLVVQLEESNQAQQALILQAKELLKTMSSD